MLMHNRQKKLERGTNEVIGSDIWYSGEKGTIQVSTVLGKNYDDFFYEKLTKFVYDLLERGEYDKLDYDKELDLDKE